MMSRPIEPEHFWTRPDVRRVGPERRARHGRPGRGVEDTACPAGRTSPISPASSPGVRPSGDFPACRSRREQSGNKFSRAEDVSRLLNPKFVTEVR